MEANEQEGAAVLPATKKRWQFNLRSFLFLALVAGVFFGRIGIEKYEQAREHAAVGELQRLGGSVTFHDGRAVGISFSGGSYTDSDLAALEQLPRLRRLVFIDTDLSEANLRQIARQPELEQLLLIDAGVSDTELASLEQLQAVKTLRLDHAIITDAGLQHLAGLTSLERLDLVGTQVGDAGLTHLASLSRLEQLYLTGTRVTDAGAAALEAKLPRVKIVH